MRTKTAEVVNPAEGVKAPDPSMLPAVAPSITSFAVSPVAGAFLKDIEGPRQSAQKIPLIKIRHAEGKFLLPTGDLADSIQGYPIYVFNVRRYYKTAYRSGDKGKPPDCLSADMVRPHHTALEPQADLCASCPMSQFATARDGRSPACGTFTWLFMINGEFGNPPVAALILSPSNLRPLFGTRFEAGYLSRMEQKYGAYEVVATTLTLRQAGDPNGQGVSYYVIEPHAGKAVDNPDTAKKLAGMRNAMRELMEQFRMNTTENETQDA